MASDRATPVLSVVVALVSGRADHLRRCLQALGTQRPPFKTEIIVSYDRAVAEVAALENEFPGTRFFPSCGTRTIRTIDGQIREHHDSLRTAGLRQARGEFVAFTEDHAYVAPGWCTALVDVLRSDPTVGAAGGAVDCASKHSINWAVYFCDFSRYQSPMPAGPVKFLSDANVAYPRSRLVALGVGSSCDYHETIVHAGLERAGLRLVATPSACAWQAREPFTLGSTLRERFDWGASYAGGRSLTLGKGHRLLYATLSPALALVLPWRAWRHSRQRGRSGQFWQVAPLVLLLHMAWTIGELTGYLRGKR